MIALVAMLLAQWNPNVGSGPARVVGVDGGPVPVYLLNGSASDGGGVFVTNFPATQPVSLASVPTHAVTLASTTVSNFPASQAVSVASLPVAGVYAQGPDGGTTFDVSGSVVSLATTAPTPNRFPLNPFLPRCNPVRRTGCQP